MNGNVHVVFGAGPLGKAVAQQLLRSGERVRLASRSGRAAELHDVEVTACDAKDADQVYEICKNAAVVYNCTGLPYQEWDQLPDIMRGLIEGVSRTKAVLVYGDNFYAYGPADGPMNEDTPYQPVGRKTRLRAQMADELMEAHRAGKLRAVIGRGADFYGPGVRLSILGSQVFENMLRNKPAQILGNMDAPHTLIYIKDFARGLILLGRHEHAWGQIWHIPSDRTLTMRQLTVMIGEQTGAAPKHQTANRFILNLLGLFNSSMREFKEIFYQFDRPFVVDDSKFKAAFNFAATPHVDAIQATVDWYKSSVTQQRI